MVIGKVYTVPDFAHKAKDINIFMSKSFRSREDMRNRLSEHAYLYLMEVEDGER